MTRLVFTAAGVPPLFATAPSGTICFVADAGRSPRTANVHARHARAECVLPPRPTEFRPGSFCKAF